jgi:mono/diheme cytochrome c family protein
MKIVNQHSPIQKLTQLFLAFLFLFTINGLAQEGDAVNGKKLYKTNCAACHKLDKKLVGPALKGISEKRDRKWLYSWIKNSSELIKSGDADAKAIFEEFNSMPMMGFPQLSDKDIDDILAYTDDKPAASSNNAAPAADQKEDPIVAKGKSIFKAKCAACHGLDKKLIGPPLRNISEKREREWLQKWINNSADLIKSGDADAKAVFDEYKIPMSAFPELTTEDVDAILAYTSYVKPKANDTNAITGGEDSGSQAKEGSDTWIIVVVVIVLLAILLWMFLSKNGFLKIVATIVTALLLAYFSYSWMMELGIDQGYEPIQPIEFSHKIHAGDNKIDCQYCHSSAKHSKTSGIPTANVCMNCHKSISEVAEDTKVGDLGKKELDAEIQKIYDAVGWDSEKYSYKENYTEKPIKWIRVHNLPDFAYYNHSQHVTVAGLKCQKCHGPVEEMDVLRQEAPLTMEWCLECHKTMEVSKDNKYYTKIHERLSKDHKKVTVADLGGRECGKCHY